MALYRYRARCDNAPHIYGVSDAAYQDMIHHKQPQHVILSGETGSGKTTAAKHLLSHISALTASNKRMSERLNSIPVVMEAFCNAQTLFNPNATRHIQYLDLTFTKSGKLSGAILWNYCLEKWRVTHASKEKSASNFHIFYYLIDSLVARSELQLYQLQDVTFSYLPPSSTHSTDSSLRKLRELREAFTSLGLEIEDQETITKIISAILLLGEIQFSTKTNVEGTGIPNFSELEKMATLLELDARKLGWGLTNYCIVKNGEVIRCRANEKKACKIRDGLARTFYSHLVDWIVNLINVKLSLGRYVL